VFCFFMGLKLEKKAAKWHYCNVPELYQYVKVLNNVLNTAHSQIFNGFFLTPLRRLQVGP
jgi:hypothetical protein